MSLRMTVVLGVLVLAACGDATPPPSTNTSTVPDPAPSTSQPTAQSVSPTDADDSPIAAETESSPSVEETTTTSSPFARPEWLGTRVLPLRVDGFGENLATPAELQARRFATVDDLDPPASGQYEATIELLTAEVLARSTWHEGCPVTVDELRYLTMSHWGFDGAVHTGEMIVNAEVADDVVGVFRALFEARFPIEQMRIVAAAELDAPPTGDGNDTTAFVCRPIVNSSGGWSQHAYGLAIDINPFHNPYEKGDLVLPELATYYTDRTMGEPGMIVSGDVVTQAFADLGWGWGGAWASLDDYMHFSRNGR